MVAAMASEAVMASEHRPAGPVHGTRVLTQEIFAYFDGLCGIELVAASYRRPFLGPVQLDLRTNRGQLVRSTLLDGIHDNRTQAIFWHPLARSRGRRFTIELAAPTLDRHAPITAWIDVPDQNDHFVLHGRLGGELLPGGLRRRLFYSWAGESPRQFDRRAFDPRVQGVMVDATISEKLLAERQKLLGVELDEQLELIDAGDRCLELGAGLGDFAHELAARAGEWIGLEPCASVRRVLRRRMAVFPNAHVVPHGKIGDLQLGTIDVIVWHAGTLRAPASAVMTMLKRLREHLVPGGRILVDDLDQGDALAWSRYVAKETREEYVPLRPGVEDPLKRRLLRQLECAGSVLRRVEWHAHRLRITGTT
ncbi:MAG: class I SAM-dependent methyltransferase [Planctomycetota bacterium]